MKKVIVYYSRMGHVKYLVDSLKEQDPSIDVIEIETLKPCYGFFGYIKMCLSALGKKQVPIKIADIDFSIYDKFIIMGPVWAGTISSPVRTFLHVYKKEIKDPQYIITHRSKKEYENVFKEMDKILGTTSTDNLSINEGKEK